MKFCRKCKGNCSWKTCFPEAILCYNIFYAAIFFYSKTKKIYWQILSGSPPARAPLLLPLSLPAAFRHSLSGLRYDKSISVPAQAGYPGSLPLPSAVSARPSSSALGGICASSQKDCPLCSEAGLFPAEKNAQAAACSCLRNVSHRLSDPVFFGFRRSLYRF